MSSYVPYVIDFEFLSTNMDMRDEYLSNSSRLWTFSDVFKVSKLPDR